MELRGEDGSKLELKSNSDTVLGRGSGFNTKDNTVSRRHVIFHLNNHIEDSRVSFQVTGKNPMWIRRGEIEKIEVFRNSETGVVAEGDMFCVSSQTPVWFCLKGTESVNLEAFDVSKIDPVEEFGFLVIGHEFDCYLKQKVRGVKNWDWFLEKSEGRSDDDNDNVEEYGGGKKKRRKKSGRGGNEEDDEDWSGESEEDNEVVLKKEVGGRPKYLLRSKEASKVRKDVKRNKISREEEEEEEDEEDETLGGFIVGDENEDDEEELDENEEEAEEELVDEDD